MRPRARRLEPAAEPELKYMAVETIKFTVTYVCEIVVIEADEVVAQAYRAAAQGSQSRAEIPGESRPQGMAVEGGQLLVTRHELELRIEVVGIEGRGVLGRVAIRDLGGETRHESPGDGRLQRVRLHLPGIPVP